MAHKVTFEIPRRPVGFADIVFDVRRNKKKFGTLRISRRCCVDPGGEVEGAAVELGADRSAGAGTGEVGSRRFLSECR